MEHPRPLQVCTNVCIIFAHTGARVTRVNSDLLNTQDDDSNDSPYSNLNVQCSYFDENQFINNFKILKNISILSLNIQSLPSKFAEFQELIQNLQINKCEPDILSIQETWQIPNLSSVSLDS